VEEEEPTTNLLQQKEEHPASNRFAPPQTQTLLASGGAGAPCQGPPSLVAYQADPSPPKRVRQAWQRQAEKDTPPTYDSSWSSNVPLGTAAPEDPAGAAAAVELTQQQSDVMAYFQARHEHQSHNASALMASLLPQEQKQPEAEPVSESPAASKSKPAAKPPRVKVPPLNLSQAAERGNKKNLPPSTQKEPLADRVAKAVAKTNQQRKGSYAVKGSSKPALITKKPLLVPAGGPASKKAYMKAAASCNKTVASSSSSSSQAAGGLDEAQLRQVVKTIAQDCINNKEKTKREKEASPKDKAKDKAGARRKSSLGVAVSVSQGPIGGKKLDPMLALEGTPKKGSAIAKVLLTPTPTAL